MNAIGHPNPIQLLGVADHEALEDFDVLTRVAVMVTGMQNAYISFSDEAHMWTASGTNDGCAKHIRADTYCSVALDDESNELVVSNVHHDPRTRAIAARCPELPITSYVGVQLKTDDGKKVGTFCVTGDIEKELTGEQLILLRGLARQAMNLLSLRAAKRELTVALASMTKLATTDGLTGMLTRRAFHENVSELRKLVLRQGGEMCLVVLDIDHFKRVNDTYGHAAGDTVLKVVAEAIRTGLRATDRIGRIGGEEFAIAMPFTGLDLGWERVEELRKTISQIAVTLGADALRVTISGGIADLRAKDTTVDGTLRRADEALYRAKSAGRDQIMVAATRELAAEMAAGKTPRKYPLLVRRTTAASPGVMSHLHEFESMGHP